MHFSPKFIRLGQNNAVGGVTGAEGGDLGELWKEGGRLGCAPVQGVAEKIGGSGTSRRRVERLRTLERRGIDPAPCEYLIKFYFRFLKCLSSFKSSSTGIARLPGVLSKRSTLMPVWEKWQRAHM